MARTKALLALMVVLGTLTSTGEAASRGREEVQTYSVPHGFAAGPAWGSWSLGIRYLKFVPRRGEHSVQFEVEDTIDIPIGARAYVETPGGGHVDKSYPFCGTSEEIRVRPGQIVYVGVIVGVCPDSTPTLPTLGTVTATFSR